MNTENASISLQDALDSMRLSDLKDIVRKLELQDVRISQAKPELIAEICASPSLSKNPRTKEYLQRVGEYFISGGKQTLTLFKVEAKIPGGFESLCGKMGELGKVISTGDARFRFTGLNSIKIHEETFTFARFDYPGKQREVYDFSKGAIKYIPSSTAECVFRCIPTGTILDIRSTADVASKLARHITKIIWGSDKHGHPIQGFHQIRLTHKLSLSLRSKFNARSFQLKVAEDDELDANENLHPTWTERLSKKHDLTELRENLGILESATDMAHGLEFDDVYEGVVFDGGCKIYMNYPTGQISFKKITSMGAYNKVITAILELENAKP